ncbi:MAG TPA: tripartite tricarboxylate transporter substrate binding protein [Acetobacteraceae bacterium]|nr:tripartite tricarboxylate transporter substrate binding protein [Acetobacteraceae bacterium]
MRRRALLGGAALAALARPVLAWPDRTITLIHGFGAGGAADTISRLIAPPLAEVLGRPVVVEPRPGAGGNIGTLALARAQPDGHTIGLLTGSHGVAAAFGRTSGFDPLDGFEWVTLFLRYGFVFAMRADNPIRDIPGLIAAARAMPDGFQYGGLGPGSSHHLTAELFAAAADVRMAQVPYRSDVAGLTAVLSGELPLMVSTTAGAMGLLRGDARLRAIAVTAARRTPLLPEVPTVAETLPGFESVTWAALAAPRGTPAPAAARLHAAMGEILERGTLRQRLAELVEGEVGLSPQAGTRDLVAAEIARWRGLIEARRLTAE